MISIEFLLIIGHDRSTHILHNVYLLLYIHLTKYVFIKLVFICFEFLCRKFDHNLSRYFVNKSSYHFKHNNSWIENISFECQ